MAYSLSASPSNQPTLRDIPKSFSSISLAEHIFISANKDKNNSIKKVLNENIILASRFGSVLTRNTILKLDNIVSCSSFNNNDAFFIGCPNLRKISPDGYLFGSAQPSSVGISTLNEWLKCSSNDSKLIWINLRQEPIIFIGGLPFVLKEISNPFRNIARLTGINGSRLEALEYRLKEDLIMEAKKCEGLLLVHEEFSNGKLRPCYISAISIKTPQELFAEHKIDYHRIPIAPQGSPSPSFFDEIFSLVTNSNHCKFVFNCGMGVGRTTVGIVATEMIIKIFKLKQNILSSSYSENEVLLRLIHAVECAIKSNGEISSAKWIQNQDYLSLKNAILGNYHIISQLTRLLPEGPAMKFFLDNVIDKNEEIINLREVILHHRIKAEFDHCDSISEGLLYLERYAILITFASYLYEMLSFVETIQFSKWLSERKDVEALLYLFRSKRGQSRKMMFFRPIESLTISNTSESVTENSAWAKIVDNRNGAILSSHNLLKMDHWLSSSTEKDKWVTNLRTVRLNIDVEHCKVFGSAQPTLEGITEIVSKISSGNIIWINLREEPLVYIQGIPYVLRDKYATLRNIKTFAGISASRLQALEFRLKSDIASEASQYGNQILVHAENESGDIVGHWIDCVDLYTISELYENHFGEKSNILPTQVSSLKFYRIPITAEDSPEAVDFDQMFKIILLNSSASSSSCPLNIILNCQMGAGRSSVGMVAASQILYWKAGINSSMIKYQMDNVAIEEINSSYKFKSIRTLLRLLRDGLEVKRSVDLLINSVAGEDPSMSSYHNLHIALHHWRKEACGIEAVDETSARMRKYAIRKGLQNLRRYFLLICFQAYLDGLDINSLEIGQVITGNMELFTNWIGTHPEIKKLLDELSDEHGSVEDLTLVEAFDSSNESSHFLSDSETNAILEKRRGPVLAPHTILKYDHFLGCQKLSLPGKRIEGAPNIRHVEIPSKSHRVFGVAMPTREAVKHVLTDIVGAFPNGTQRVLWICLREEPVLFVNGKPYVLRTSLEPVTNLETTGINRQRVEEMELRMKKDTISETRKYGDRFLLHEEAIGGAGGFSVVPVWENVHEKDIQTCYEVWNEIKDQNYPLEYLRVPITDEQSPIPIVFDELVSVLRSQDSKTDIIYNCQMGRGRTTTGMVISYLLDAVTQEDFLSSLSKSQPRSSEGDEMDKSRFLNGEYRLITQLVQVLPNGRFSKLLVDTAINACSHLQNLREAIYDFKIRHDSAVSEAPSKNTIQLRERGLNYLIRYFYLIAFADYLIEKDKKISTFTAWLEERKEITNLTENRPIIDFS